MKEINGVRDWPTISLLHVYGDLSFLLYLLLAKHCSVENIQGKIRRKSVANFSSSG